MPRRRPSASACLILLTLLAPSVSGMERVLKRKFGTLGVGMRPYFEAAMHARCYCDSFDYNDGGSDETPPPTPSSASPVYRSVCMLLYRSRTPGAPAYQGIASRVANEFRAGDDLENVLRKARSHNRAAEWSPAEAPITFVAEILHGLQGRQQAICAPADIVDHVGVRVVADRAVGGTQVRLCFRVNLILGVNTIVLGDASLEGAGASALSARARQLQPTALRAHVHSDVIAEMKDNMSDLMHRYCVELPRTSTIRIASETEAFDTLWRHLLSWDAETRRQNDAEFVTPPARRLLNVVFTMVVDLMNSPTAAGGFNNFIFGANTYHRMCLIVVGVESADADVPQFQYSHRRRRQFTLARTSPRRRS